MPHPISQLNLQSFYLLLQHLDTARRLVQLWLGVEQQQRYCRSLQSFSQVTLFRFSTTIIDKKTAMKSTDQDKLKHTLALLVLYDLTAANQREDIGFVQRAENGRSIASRIYCNHS